MKQQTNTLETPEISEIEEILNDAANIIGAPPEGFENDYSQIPQETLQLWADEEEAIRLYKIECREGKGGVL